MEKCNEGNGGMKGQKDEKTRISFFFSSDYIIFAGHLLRPAILIMVYMKRHGLLFALLMPSALAWSQYAWQEGADPGKPDLCRDITYKVEAQGSFSNGQTPLWLNANKHGLSSLDECNGYLRAALVRPLQADSARRWGVGYGVDVAAAANYTSDIVVQQAFAEVRWLHGVLTVGAKEWPMELKNQTLSSGSQTLGINARPVPQVRLALPQYFTLPFGHRWLHVKGHVAYGKLTDGGWQEDFSGQQSKYNKGTLYHSKAGYLKIGNGDRFCPFSVEMGLEMATLFGGTTYIPQSDGTMQVINNKTNLESYLHALTFGGGDVTEYSTDYVNTEGDMLGSWVMRVNYDTDSWRLSLYADKFFEDHSGMFQVAHNGYGSGEDWNKKEHFRFHLYDLKDWMLGAELELKHHPWLRHIVGEYIYTKYQSGSVYHDHTPSRESNICGIDDYYNHSVYSGWQHWGQVIGNPLYLSPIYNEDGQLCVKNNRFVAWHLGIDGQPTERLSYRIMYTYQTGWGTYDDPYVDKQYNTSLLVELSYRFPKKWQVKLTWGADYGKIYGYNNGLQITIAKTGNFSL